MPRGAKDGVLIVPSMYTLITIHLSQTGELQFLETGNGTNNIVKGQPAPFISAVVPRL